MKKIVVCISKVPDTTAKIEFKENNTKFDDSGVQFIVNPYDEWYALVKAIELKEKFGYSVTVIHVGEAENDSTIRKTLAIGADNAVRINKTPLDSFDTAFEIANYIKANPYDYVFTGKETINYNGSCVGAQIAQLLDYSFLSQVASLELESDLFKATCELQDGEQLLEIGASSFFVMSAVKGIAEARIPNMRGIMSARSKPIVVVEPKNHQLLTEVVSYELPDQKKGCKLIDKNNVEELVMLLKNEAKVL